MLEISIWPMVCECSSGSMFWRTTALMSWANSGLYHGVDFINEHIFPFGYDCIISNQCQVVVYFFMLMSRKDGVFSRATFDKNGALMFNWQSIIQNFQIFVTIIGAVVGGIAMVSGIPKIYLETSLARRNRGREEYRFAKEFLSDLHGEKSLHPFLREKGCQAITGGKNTNRYHMECLLSMDEPGVALQQYFSGKKYVELVRVENASVDFSFKRKYKNKIARIKARWFIVYAASLVALCLIPRCASAIFHDMAWRVVFACFWLFAETFLIIFFLRFASGIENAEKLVRSFRTTD